MKTPKNNAAQPKELEDLERFHQRMKEEAQAWRKLLGNMGKLKNHQNDSTTPPRSPDENDTAPPSSTPSDPTTTT